MKNTIRHRTAKFSVMAGSVAAVAGAALVLPLSGMSGAAAPQIAQIFQPSGATTQVASGATITDQTTVEVKVPGQHHLGDRARASTSMNARTPMARPMICRPTARPATASPRTRVQRSMRARRARSTRRATRSSLCRACSLSEPSNPNPVCTATSACVLYVGREPQRLQPSPSCGRRRSSSVQRSVRRLLRPRSPSACRPRRCLFSEAEPL